MIGHFDISTGFTFRGEYDETKEYQAGDICVRADDSNSPYVYVGNKFWDCIAYTTTSYNEDTQIKKITYPTNCKNCGAVLHNNICEYCDTDNKEERI